MLKVGGRTTVPTTRKSCRTFFPPLLTSDTRTFDPTCSFAWAIVVDPSNNWKSPRGAWPLTSENANGPLATLTKTLSTGTDPTSRYFPANPHVIFVTLGSGFIVAKAL